MENAPEPRQTGRQIAQKTVRGIFWNFLAYGLSKGIVLVTTSILARVLSRDDFGLVAVAVVAINYLSVVKDLGLGVALIQRRGDVNDAANTVFTLNVILGFFLSAILFPIAPFVADYFKDPMVVPVLRWLGLSFFINSIGSVHVVWLMRELDYRRKMIPDITSALIKGLASIGLAFAGFGVWALVWGQLIGAATSVILFWIVYPWRPRFALDRKVTGALMKFGLSVIGGDILSVSIDNLGHIIIGRLFGLAQLGIFSLAYRLPEMLLIGNLWIMASVTFSAFSSIQDQRDELRRGFLASVRLVQLFAIPICLGLVIAADPIVRVVFGEQWLDSIPILRVLAVYALVTSIGYHIGDVYKAIGRPDILLKLTIFTLAVIAPALLIGSRYGLLGIAWAYVVAFLIDRVVGILVATRFIEVSLMDVFREMSPALRGGLVMTAAALPVLYWTEPLGPFLQLACVVLAGAASYLFVLWRTEKDNLLKLASIVRKSG